MKPEGTNSETIKGCREVKIHKSIFRKTHRTGSSNPAASELTDQSGAGILTLTARTLCPRCQLTKSSQLKHLRLCVSAVKRRQRVVFVVFVAPQRLGADAHASLQQRAFLLWAQSSVSFL